MKSKFPLDLSKFRKMHSDKTTTTLRHPEGHEIKLAHEHLSPKMRSQLAELPSVAMADGGGVDDVPEPNKKKAQAAVADNQRSGWRPEEWVKNVKESLGMADGGKVTDKSEVADPDPKKAAEFTKGLNTPMTMDSAIQNLKEGLGLSKPKEEEPKKRQNYDEGGQVASTSSEAPPATAPVTINISPGAQNLIPDAQVNPNAGANAAAQAPSNMSPAAIAASSNLPYGVNSEQAIQATSPGSQVTAEPSTAPEATPQAAAPKVPSGPNDPYGTEAHNKAYVQGLTEQKTGLEQEANALGQEGQEQAKKLMTGVAVQEAAKQTYQDHYDQLDTERKAFQQDMMNEHIDPNHYMNNRTTGERITNAIGLILGGFGAISGQSNMAHDYINNQIARDIDAQKAELGKKQSLLSANLHQFGNLRDATDMTRLMQTDIISNNLKLAAANAATPLARARALQAAGKLDIEAAPIMSQIAMRRTLLSAANNGTIAPENVIRAIVPPGAQQDATFKELKEAQSMSATRDNLLDAFNKIYELNTLGNKVGSPWQTNSKIDAIKGPLLGSLVKDTEGRITPADLPLIDSLFPKMTDNDETKALKVKQLNSFVSQKMHYPQLKAIGIDVGNMSKFSPQGQSKITEVAPNVK